MGDLVWETLSALSSPCTIAMHISLLRALGILQSNKQKLLDMDVRALPWSPRLWSVVLSLGSH